MTLRDSVWMALLLVYNISFDPEDELHFCFMYIIIIINIIVIVIIMLGQTIYGRNLPHVTALEQC